MKIVSITYRCGETVPLEVHGGPKFANVQPSVEVGVELDPTDNPADARQQIQQRALAALEELKKLMIAQAIGDGAPIAKQMSHGGTWPAVQVPSPTPGIPVQQSIVTNPGIPLVEPTTF